MYFRKLDPKKCSKSHLGEYAVTYTDLGIPDWDHVDQNVKFEKHKHSFNV